MTQAIGQQLRSAREARNLSLEQVAQSTHMRLRYLQAMEAGEFDSLPSMAQARGFLRSYAGFLKLDAEPLLAALENLPGVPALPDEPSGTAALQAASEPALEGGTHFEEIGRQLRRQRELLGLSLDDVERYTHLRQRNLQALETGQLDWLPSPVQARGMLNNYAAFLGLDAEPLLLLFAEGLQARLAVKQAARVEPRPKPKRRVVLPRFLRRLLSVDILVGGSLALFLVAFMVWGAIRIFTVRSGQQASPTAPSIADVLLATATASETPTPEPVTPSPAAPGEGVVPVVLPTGEAEGEGTPVEGTAEEETAGPEITTAAASGVQVYLTVLQRAYLRVTVDGKIEFEGRVLPGSAYTYAGKEQVEILTGNAAALQVFFNQQDLGLLGSFGQVVNVLFTTEGIQTPTPTITPTITATPRTTPTPRPTTVLAGTPVQIP